MPGQFAFKPTLARIWHAPDRLRIMDPLPPLHRRGIILAAVVIIICFLWPSPEEPTRPVTRDAQLDIRSSSQEPMQAELVNPPASAPQTTQPVEPQQVQEPAPAENQASQPFQPKNNDIDQQWRTYRVESGKTLAQLFRDHNLPATDIYAMAKVEGEGKPLSNLQTGQMVQVRQNASGVVTALTIDVSENQQVLFTRQPDGSFIRVR